MFKCELTGKEYDLNDEKQYNQYLKDKESILTDKKNRESCTVEIDGKYYWNGEGVKFNVEETPLSEYDTMDEDEFLDLIEEEAETGEIHLSSQDLTKLKRDKNLRGINTSNEEIGKVPGVETFPPPVVTREFIRSNKGE